jgi:hypothetical protein
MGSVVVYRDAENRKWTDLFLKRYNIQKIALTLSHAAINGVLERRYRPIADAICKPPGSSNKPNEM